MTVGTVRSCFRFGGTLGPGEKDGSLIWDHASELGLAPQDGCRSLLRKAGAEKQAQTRGEPFSSPKSSWQLTARLFPFVYPGEP